MQFTQKETIYLKDLKEAEQTCVEKYRNYAAQAHDGQLKGLFTQISQKEQQHLDTINQIMSGTVPSMQSGGGNQPQLGFTPVYAATPTDPHKQKDSFLCTDLLSTEKHVSSVYNTAIFEFQETNVRDALNHIQKEEQQHGEQIFNYMAQNGMYG
ncbi:MAG: spore coat protein [Christensenellales bacterium]|jgi:spore coat protein CotF